MSLFFPFLFLGRHKVGKILHPRGYSEGTIHAQDECGSAVGCRASHRASHHLNRAGSMRRYLASASADRRSPNVERSQRQISLRWKKLFRDRHVRLCVPFLPYFPSSLPRLFLALGLYSTLCCWFSCYIYPAPSSVASGDVGHAPWKAAYHQTCMLQ